MAEGKMERPVTFGDVFNVPASISSEPITQEDAGLMQSAESAALGHTQKGGAASVMQTAADYNVRIGAVDPHQQSFVAEKGFTVSELRMPGRAIDTEYVAGVPVAGTVRPTPTTPEVAAGSAITIGEALEAASMGARDQAIEEADARAIQSAEVRATGAPLTAKYGIAAVAQSAAELNPRVEDYAKTTLGDVLSDATYVLPSDKVVTEEDAAKVEEAEMRAAGHIRPGGVAAAMKIAADLNVQAGLVASPDEAGLVRASDQAYVHQLTHTSEKESSPQQDRPLAPVAG